MSLKRIMVKPIAIMVATYMVIGNVAITGIGLGKVIAEEIQIPEVTVESAVQKYVPYNIQDESGVVLQEIISIGDNSNEQTHKQVEKVELNIQVPEVKGIKPSRVSILSTNMGLSTGKEEQVKSDYSKDNGLLNISYKNTNQYSQYKQNAKDQIELIYIYPAKVEQNEQMQISTKTNAKVTYKTEAGNRESEKQEDIQAVLSDKKGELTNYDVVKASTIYKGYLYSNEFGNENYETNYKTTGKVSVINKDLVDSTKIDLEKSDYQTENGIVSTDTIVYISSYINENEFNRLYGKNGAIEIYLGETKYASIEYSEADKEKDRKYQTTYYTEAKPENVEAGKIVYPEGTTNVTLKTSKPVTEGILNIENEKAIKASNNYGVPVKKIKTILEKSTIEGTKIIILEEFVKNENGEIVKDENGKEVKQQKNQAIKVVETSTKGQIELKEPTVQMQAEIDNNNFSTLENNKTKLTIKLNDTNNTCKLFEEGEIKVKLPNNLTNVKITTAKVLYENGIKIAKANIKNGYIVLTVEGKQTSYDLENINGGVNIVIGVETDIEDTIASHKETMEITYGNTKIEKEINIVSKYGLLMLSKTTGYDAKGSTKTIIDGNINTIELAEDQTEKQAVQTLNLVNNYGQDMANMQIVGKIGYTNKDLISTFDTTLVKPIEVNKNAKIYYSENKNATYEDNSWKEEFSYSAKAYKIVLNEDRLEKENSVQVKITIKIPTSLGYNQSTYLQTEANYIVNNQKGRDTSTLGMQTKKEKLATYSVQSTQEVKTNNKQNVPINISITPIVTQSDVHSGQVVTYRVKIQNTSKTDLKNIVVEDVVPQNAIYTYQAEKDGNICSYLEIEKDENKKNILWKIDKLKAEEAKEYEIMLTMGNVTKEEKITNKINLKYNNQIISEESSLNLKPAVIIASLTTGSDNVVNKTYRENETLNYYIKIKNITNYPIQNVKVQYNIPENITFLISGIENYDENEGYTLSEQKQINNNVLEANIETLNSQEEKTIKIEAKVSKLKNGYEANITGIANIQLGTDNYQTNIKTIKTQQASFIITQYSNIKNTEPLSAGDEVVYTIKVKNVGVVSGGFNIKDAVPEQIEVEKFSYRTDNNELQTIGTSNQEIDIINSLNPNEILTVQIKGKVKEELTHSNTIAVHNVANLETSDETVASNKVEVKVEPTDTKENKETTNTICGIAWVDSNKDGKKDEEENTLSGISAMLLNAQTAKLVTDVNGQVIKVTTDENGKYQFTEIENGTYIVIYELDTNKYSATVYKANGAQDEINSKVIIGTATINGKTNPIGKTDYITVNNDNAENINVGLVEKQNFDISLNKSINNVTIIGKDGSKVKDYNNVEKAKVKLTKDDSDLLVKYKLTLKNEGQTEGYVNNLTNELPSGLEFNSELNTDWYKGTDGKLYTTKLSGTTLQPGETKEVELILTKKVNNKASGTILETAQAEKTSNLQNSDEINIENNTSQTTLNIKKQIVSPWVFVIITIICLGLIGVGAYFIKIKYLDKEEN